MRVSVGICTWNRARLLEQTLSGMERLRIPPGVDWEVLVVNNRCSDDTDDVIARHAGRLPLRWLFEPRPGKSHALNAAVAALRSDLTLWIDDDALPEPQWLEEYVRAFQESPAAAFYGGPIDPWFEIEPPAWLLRAFPLIGFTYATLDLGKAPCPLSKGALPFGANYAIRTSVQKAYTYDPKLGRIHSWMLAGEETELFERLLADGHEGAWVPGARVRHWVPRERMTEKYLREYFFGLGQTEALRGKACQRRRRPYLCWRALVSDVKYQLFRRIGGPSLWVRALTRASYLRGLMAGPVQERRLA